MSFVKKAFKKVFKVAKSVVKKIWKPALFIGAGLLTAGLATVGFSGFGAAMSAAGGGLGGFLSAVGSTISTGFSTITGALGFGSGTATGTATGTAAGGSTIGSAVATGGAEIGSGVLGATFNPATLTTTGAAAAASAAVPLATATTAVTGGGAGFVGSMLSGLKSFAGTDVGKIVVANAISGGISSYLAGRQADREREAAEAANFFGDRSIGGEEEARDFNFFGIQNPVQNTQPQFLGA